jgi:superfamily I DNA/RNA helicase
MERSKQRPAPVGKFQVRIMSFQSSRGLEANIVLVIGLEEGQYPSDDSPDRIAEAARLVFVAMTRAQDKLHLFHARKRTGSVSLRDKSHQLSQSRFLTGLKIPKENRIYHPAKT